MHYKEKDWRCLLILTAFLRELALNASVIHKHRTLIDLHYRTFGWLTIDEDLYTHPVLRTIDTWADVLSKLDGCIGISKKESVLDMRVTSTLYSE
jgi:hypothetical protein